MTWTSTLAICAASSAIVAAPLLIRLSAVNAKASLYKAWWERDSARAIIAEAQLDVIAEQRRSAGRQSHKAEKALFAATTEKLKQCVERRKDIPAGVQRPGKRAERAGVRSRRQDAGLAPWPTLLAKGDSIDPECRLAKPRGVIPPLLTNTTMKGA